jgi:PAS domain S-box-containing protein
MTSIVFFILFVWLYRSQLERERSQASLEVNRLLQASLENAMLKRDLDGLRGIVNRLGFQEEINNVMIVNPHNEVRFSSDPEMLGRRFDSQKADACAVCHTANGVKQQATVFVRNERGQEVLRSVNPVSNKPICSECHGSVADNPINGVLFVDYEAGPIRQQAQTTAMLFVGSGILVVLITLGGGSWFMRHFVLHPVNRLANASRALGKGELDTRIHPSGTDELALLGHEFDHMATRLQGTLHEVQEREQFSQSLIDADPDGIRVIDDKFQVVMANRTYCKQLGLKKHEAAGVSCYASHGRQQPCPPTLETCPLHEIKETGQPVKAVHRHIRANGDEFWVEIFAAPVQVKIKGEKRTLIVESVRDLATGIAYSHEQKLSTIGQLATGVAHEIQNPLASIRLALQNVERHITHEKGDVKEFHEYLKLVDEQVDRSIDVT